MSRRAKRKSSPAPQWTTFRASFYCPSGGVGNGLTTKSGAHVSSRTLAVDPSVIPLGSVVEIKYPDGHTEVRVAEDTGGLIRGHRLDVFVWTESEAIQRGVKMVKVRIIGHKAL